MGMVFCIVPVMMAGMLFLVEAVIVAVTMLGNFHLKLGVPVQFSMGEPVGQMGKRRIQAGAKHGKRDHQAQAGPPDLICLQRQHKNQPFRNGLDDMRGSRLDG